MIRFIFKHVSQEDGQSEHCYFETVDIENEEVETILTSGGFGESRRMFSVLVSAEVIEEAKDEKK